MQLYILMIDYGHKRADQDGPVGMEAVVNPETTRRGIVAEVRDIIARGQNSVAFVKFIDGNHIEDVTEDILEEASVEADPTFDRPNAADALAAKWDRARDERKHGEAV